MSTTIRYRRPPRSRGARGKPLARQDRPELRYSPEELDAVRAGLAARIEAIAEDLEAKGILAQLIAIRDRGVCTDGTML